MQSDYVLYSPHTDLGRRQGLGNHLYIFYTTYSYCIDNGIEMRIDEDAHPVMKNMLLQKQKRINNAYYSIEHLSDLKANGIPFQMHNASGSSDINGFNFSLYVHNIPKIRNIMNIPDVSTDICVMHVRVYTALPHLNVGLPFYINAIKQVTSKRILIMSGYNNWDIKTDITKQNVDYLISKLSVIYPDKEFIDIMTFPEYTDSDADIEAMKHWYLCATCKELIAPPSTFSLSAAMLRGDRLTITSKHQNIYGAKYDLREVADNIIYIPRNVVVSAWYDVCDTKHEQLQRLSVLQELFEKINNADIILYTNDVRLFKDFGVAHLSHIRIIELPFDKLYANKYIQYFEHVIQIPSFNGCRSNVKRQVLWNSKVWLVALASKTIIRELYDRICWLDAAIFKITDVKCNECFPILERYCLNSIYLHSLDLSIPAIRERFEHHDVPGGFMLFPSPVHLYIMHQLYDVVLSECTNMHIYLDSEEPVISLLVNLVGGLFNVTVDKAHTPGVSWLQFVTKFSTSFADYRKNRYADIIIEEPVVDTKYLLEWIKNHRDISKYDPSRVIF